MRPVWPTSVIAGSPAKTEDIQSLRDEIGSVRQRLGLSAISWTAITTLKASDFIQMRDAIQDIWNVSALNFGDLPDWTQGTPTAGFIDPAAHVMDLRVWLGRASDFPPEQGVDTYSYSPVNQAQTQWAGIGSGWVGNIQGLTSGAPADNKIQYVRCKIVSMPDGQDKRVILSQDEPQRDGYVAAFNTYKNQLRVFAVLNLETYLRDSSYDVALGAVGGVQNTSDYIEEFATEFGALHSYFGPAGVLDYIIWNEPNDDNPAVQPKFLAADQFAALLRRCWQKVVKPAPVATQPRIYWGGILFTGVPSQMNPETGQVEYVENVYAAVRNQLTADPETERPPNNGLPWSGINIHLHHTPLEQSGNGFVKSLLRNHIWPLQIEYGDGGWIIVGEWGITRKDLTDDSNALLKAFQRIRPWATTMFYFTHPDFPQKFIPNPTPPPNDIPDPDDWWGLVNRDVQGGSWVTLSDAPQGPKYRDALD